jgi:formamidopyrimidine-DNA glycosylase
MENKIMPELPEVETVRNTLKTLIVGKEIRDIDVYYEKMIRNREVDEFKKALIGKKIIDIDRYGKYLIFNFEGTALISHLRMEGKYFFKDLDEKKEKHEHVIFYFTDGKTLRYNDTRKFGTMDLYDINDVYDKSPVSKIGYEPFEKEMTGKYLMDKLSKKSIAIKSALLDQTIIAGLGNIYVDEVLFLSKIHPTLKANSLELADYKRLVKNSVKVLNKAVKLGGSTIRSYTSSLGVTGRFQNELFVHTKQGDSCLVCNTEILKTKVNGRGTYYCPSCQKEL